jgi:hypothetical protein
MTPTWLLDDNNLRLWLLYNNTRLLRVVLWLLLRDVYGLLCVSMAVYVLPQQGARNACQCSLFTRAPSMS